MNKRKRDIREHQKTSFANSGRVAGTGMLHDNYDEESGGWRYGDGNRSFRVMLLSDYMTKEQKAALSGPVIIKRIEDL